MTVYLHIGTGKTGTTTIQTFLETNRDVLRSKGLIVPTSLGRQNHRNLAAYSLNDDQIDNSRRAKRLTTPERIAAFRGKLVAGLLAEAPTWPADASVVMTSEQLTRLRRPGEIERLHDLLARTGHPVKVIAYLRRQDDYFASEYSQLIKGGQSLPFSIDNKLNMAIYNYDHFLGSWASVFGDDNMIVRPFERGQFVQGDLLMDFLSLVGVSEIEGCVSVDQKNPSLDAQTVEFLRLLNPDLPRWADEGADPVRAEFVRQLEAVSDGPRLKLSSEQATALLARFEDSNAAVARRYLGREDGRLFLAPVHDGEGREPGLTTEQSIAIAVKMWRQARDSASPGS